jgi:hypothetical protein
VRDASGLVLAVMMLDVLDGQIQNVRSVIDPDKLRHLGPVADAWAVEQEYRGARRHDRAE